MALGEGSSKPPRRTSSKYDFVKVKVWIGENSDHYYVLSRFLVSRMLTVTKISNVVAIKIALELKKLLVDNNLLDVSQADLEANLFKLMQKRGYGEEYISRYKMMTSFHHRRVPLLVLVGGTACVGKSTIATQLAQRLNLPNVLQTDIIYELLRTDPNNAAPLNATPLWGRTDLTSTEDLMQEYRRECRVIRKGVDGDLTKTMSEGKPLTVEGLHLDPGIYLSELPQARIGRPTRTKPQKVHPIEASEAQPRVSEADSEEGTNSREAEASTKVKAGNELVQESNSLKINARNSSKQSKAKRLIRTRSLAEAKEFLKSLGRGKSQKVTPNAPLQQGDEGVKVETNSKDGREKKTQSQPLLNVQRPSLLDESSSAEKNATEKEGELLSGLVIEGRRTSNASGLHERDSRSGKGEKRLSEQVTGTSTSSVTSQLGKGAKETGRKSNGNEEPQLLDHCEQNGMPSNDAKAGSQESISRERESGQAEQDSTSAESRKEEPILVPIVLRMSEEDHGALIDEWMASRSGEVGDDVRLDKAAVLQKLRAIQDYLCSFEDQGVAVVDVSTTSFAQTLDWLHGYLLECIQDGWSGVDK